MNCLSEPLQPFRVDAKILRPGLAAVPKPKPAKPGDLDVYIRCLEVIVVVGPFTLMSAPLIVLGVIVVYAAIPALAGAFGLYGLWTLLLYPEETLCRDRSLRLRAILGVACGSILATLFMIGFGPKSGWVFYILLAQVLVALHRVWRLQRLMLPLGIAEEGRILLRMRRSALALGVTLERFGKPELPPRHAKWGARL